MLFKRRKTAKKHPVLNVLISTFFLACIAFVIALCIFLFSKTIPVLGIVLSSVLSAFLMIPATLYLLPFFKSVNENMQTEKDLQILKQKEEIASLKSEAEQFASKQEAFEHKLKLLQNLTFNMETYKDVFKICFRDYQQVSTIKQREKFNEADFTNSFKKLIGQESKNYDEVLSIMDCLISYQRGVDLQNIKIAKINDDTVVVSGITPEYTTVPKFEYKEFFSEYRHVKLDKNGDTRHITVETDEQSARELASKQNEYKASFEDSFMSGHQQDADAEEIIKRAQNFIKIILQSIYKHVEFDDAELTQDAVPLLEYLRSETKLYQNRLDAISQEEKHE
ncbi:MAG TPA: hypothetical protein DCQ43_04230 [Treponema sp.]|nr:hypothetical protein [Treponema sp.]